jgi:hypothetical protein
MHDAPRRIERRAFVRGAVLTAVAAAATAGARPRGLVARAVEPGDVPRLDVAEPVTGVASAPDRLVAVGGHAASPRVWTLDEGALGWRRSADDPAFAAATSLLDVAARGQGIVAVGWTETSDGPRAAAFGSRDGGAWVPEGVPGLGHAVATCVAARDGVALAAGTTFAEPGVREPAATFALVDRGDGSWEPVALDGVEPPRHGAVTMLAATRTGFRLGAVGVDGAALYGATSAWGPWRRLAAPTADASTAFLACADTDAGVLLAGLDGDDRPRFWLETGRGWRETRAPSGLDAAARVVGLAAAPGSLLAAGADDAGSFVEEVTAA